jgi:flagellar FliL protein
MADTEDEEGAAEKPAAAPKRKLKLMVIAAAAVLLLAGGGAVWFLFFRHPAEQIHAEVAAPKPPMFMDVPDMMVNLVGSPGERVQYLKVKVVLEVKDAPLVAQITPTMPRVTDVFQTYLRELRPSDLNGSAGMFRLKEELTRRVNTVIAPGQVNAVLFKEIVIQ